MKGRQCSVQWAKSFTRFSSGSLYSCNASDIVGTSIWLVDSMWIIALPRNHKSGLKGHCSIKSTVFRAIGEMTGKCWWAGTPGYSQWHSRNGANMSYRVMSFWPCWERLISANKKKMKWNCSFAQVMHNPSREKFKHCQVPKPRKHCVLVHLR